MKTFKFDKNEMKNYDLNLDAVYEGGSTGNKGDEVLSKLLGVSNSGGFRISGSYNNPKFIVLYTSGEDLDWPDNLSLTEGIFEYYGDNKTPGKDIHETSKKGNLILRNLFEYIHDDKKREEKIPPIFVFKKFPTSNSNYSVQFKGIAVPGVPGNNDYSLTAIWRTKNEQRFQNYKATFTILDEPKIYRKWIEALISGDDSQYESPANFKKWKRNGIYTPLIAPKTIEIRGKEEQLPSNINDSKLLQSIHKYFNQFDPVTFEPFAAWIYAQTLKDKILIDKITKASSDGGRDAIGRLKLGINDDPIYVDFFLEAKCYDPDNNAVNTKETSRLISRIRNRQYGVIVTTSYIGKKAYKEVREDEHPIIFITGKDIINILRNMGYGMDSIKKEFTNIKP